MERRGWLSGDESEAAVGVQARGRGGTETDEDGDGEGWLQRSRLEASAGVRACGGRREARVVKKGHPCRGWTSPPVAPEGGDDAECAGTCRDAVIVIWSRQSVSLLRQTRSVQWSPPRPSLGLRLRFLAGLSGICSRGDVLRLLVLFYSYQVLHHYHYTYYYCFFYIIILLSLWSVL